MRSSKRCGGCDMPTHVPFTVTAHLLAGVGMNLPYGLDLAGLLAARVRVLARESRALSGNLLTSPLPDSTEEEPEDLTLPLARCVHAGGEEWHWMGSCAIPVDANPDPAPRTFYRVVDAAWAQRAADRPLPYVHGSHGPYRDVMMAAPVLVCQALQWRAVGDPDETLRLLSPMRFIGRRHATGEGQVLSWSVETVVADPFLWAHTDGDDLVRPVPVACAQTAGVPYRLGWYALRPPSWHPGRLRELAMTDDTEQW